MLKVYTRANDSLSPLTLEVDAEHQPPMPASPVPWIDIVNPTQAEDRYVENVAGVSIPTREEMQEIEASSRLYSENGAEFMTLSVVANIDTEDPEQTPITFVLKGQTLVTVRYMEPRPFVMFINRVQRTGAIPCASGEQVMMGLLEAIIDRIADALERVGAKVESISRSVFVDAKEHNGTRSRDFQKAIIEIGREGDRLSMIRESLVSITRVLTYHNAVTDDGKKAAKEARQRLRTLQRDASSLTEHSAYLTSKITFLLDATLGLINLEQNQIIKIFSIAAVCLMPPTLIASIYGMNFKHMPELASTWGYPLALLGMLIAAILPFVYFKRKGWL